MPSETENGGKFFRIAKAAKLCGLSVRTLRRMADRGDIATVWRGSHRVFPVASTHAYAQSIGAAKAAEENVDALAFGMMREGRSDEAIVLALTIPLARVLKLREHREGARPLAKVSTQDEAELERQEERMRAERKRERHEAEARERAERRRGMTG